MSDPSDIVWEEPPVSRYHPADVWRDRLAFLMEHPGKWARVKVCGTKGSAWSLAGDLRRKARDAEWPGRWEFTGRSGSVYARWFSDA